MNCNYPSCHYPEKYTPVILIPTVRTIGMPAHRTLRPVDGDPDELVKTDKPTQLIGKTVCRLHMDTYKVTDWINEHEWKIMEEAAAERGLHLDLLSLVRVEFKPLGWIPGSDHLELERT